MESDNPLPLNWLNDGFTTLEDALVPVAYAQSLFAAKTLINSSGFGAMTKYLQYLNEGRSPEQAFFQAFGKSLSVFEDQLAQQLIRWSETEQVDP